MNSLSDLNFMVRIKLLLLSYSYRTNIYLFSLFEVTGNLPVKSVAIWLLWSMILVKTVFVCCESGDIGGSSSFVGSCYLVDLMFFLVWCMWPLDVSIDGGRCLLFMLIVNLVLVAKYLFLIYCIRVRLTGLNSVVWYHCVRSGLVLFDINLFSDWCVGVGLGCGVVDRCTCNMPAAPLRVPSRTTFIFSLLLCIFQWMWLYSHHNIASLWRLVTLIGVGGRCVMFWPLWITRG